MYEAEVRCVEQVMSQLQAEAPIAFAFLTGETSGAATALEYYVMLGAAMDSAFRSGLIPTAYETWVDDAKAAIRKIYETV